MLNIGLRALPQIGGGQAGKWATSKSTMRSALYTSLGAYYIPRGQCKVEPIEHDEQHSAVNASSELTLAHNMEGAWEWSHHDPAMV
jgi:hypothetical protein